MNLLKSMFLFFALCLIGTNTTFAQSRTTNLTEEQKEEIKKNIEEYSAALHLSEEQKPKFEEITKKYAKQMKAVKDSGGRPMSKFKKVKSIRKNKDAEMKQLLSKDQYKVYLEKQEEMKKKMKERRKGR
jgi:tRNA U34 5-carboxymethylaminomethyl modifying enzyme MnmG/GidA